MTDFGTPALVALIPPEELEWLRALSVRRSYRDGEMIHDRGDPQPGIGLVVKGRVKLVTPRSSGRETFITFVDPGHHYGDVGLMDRHRRVHRALAFGETEVDHVTQDDFPRLLERPAILRALYEIASFRLALLIDVMDDMRGLPPETRVAKLLLLMHARNGGSARIDFLQEDFANMLGVSTVTLSKAFRVLRDQGLADTGYRQVIIRDAARLREWLAIHDPD